MKKFFSIVLVLLLLVGCTSKSTFNSKEYLNELSNYKIKDKTDNQNDNEDFNKFLDQVFKEAMESDYTTMHFSVIDYQKYDIEKPAVNLGEISYGFDQDSIDYFAKQLADLRSYDFDSLSRKQQYDYEALEYSLLETLAGLGFYQYTFLFGQESDLLSNVATILSDFPLYNQESIDDYLVLLTTADDYINSALEYTAKQQKDRIYMTDGAINYAIDYIDGFVSKTDDNAIVKGFEKSLNDADFVDSSKINDYIEECRKIVKEEIIPSFTKVKETLSGYLGKGNYDNNKLSNLNPDYAKLTYMLNVSTNDDVQEIFDKTMDAYDNLIALANTALYDEEAIKEYLDIVNSGVLNSMPAETYLKKLATDLPVYPKLNEVDFTCDYIDASSASDTIAAYYWQAPIDNLDQNIIKLNPNNVSSGTSYYLTLSHEGIPGHLYQHIFYQQTNPHTFRSAIGFIGYTEGWAVDAEANAANYLNIQNENTRNLIMIDSVSFFLEYSIIDMGLNYFDWDINKINEFEQNNRLIPIQNYIANYDVYKEEGFTISDVEDYIKSNDFSEFAKSISEWLIDTPGSYCSYGAGYSYYQELKEKAIEKGMDLTTFYQLVLENGPLPFNILEESVLN